MSSDRPELTRSDPLHLQIARHIRNDIAAGVLRDGDVLPSTRELAETWSVSVFTISEAMKTLSEEGLVVSKSRSKRVVQSTQRQKRDTLRLEAPQVLLVGGYAGSGKTQLGRVLSHETGWPMLDKDTLTRPVVELALEAMGLSPHDRESPEYLEKIRPTEYAALRAAMHENVSCGNSAIVTAPFLREFRDEKWIAEIRSELSDLGASATLVWVYCDADTMHSYIRHRGAERDTAKLADWNGYLTAVDTEFRPASPHVVIRNCGDGPTLVEQAKALLSEMLGAEPE